MSQSHTWSGVLAPLDAVSSDRHVLVLPSGGDVPHHDLPLPVVLTLGEDRRTVGSIEKVWRTADAVWASGFIIPDPASSWGRRLLRRDPHPVDLVVEDGLVAHRYRRRWHAVERLWGHRRLTVAVATHWRLASAALVDEAAWPDSFITLDDE